MYTLVSFLRADANNSKLKKKVSQNDMAQFDSLIIFPLIWSSLFVLFLHYSMSIQMLIPYFFGAKKFREKKLGSPVFYGFFKNNIEVKSNYSYSVVS